MATARKKEGTKTVADVLGACVRGRRGDLGLSQVELAGLMSERRGHRWTHGTVSRIETGQAEPTLSELVSLMLTLRSSFAELVDTVRAGNEPVDLGLGHPVEAEDARAYLTGDYEAWRRGPDDTWIPIRKGE